MKKLSLISTLVFFVIIQPAGAADLHTGLAAYERRDYQTALGHMMQLAEAGDPDAQFIMGRMFSQGSGILQDYIEAHKWYNLAASNGQRLAAAARDVIAENMSPAQLEQAQERARDWRPIGRLPDSSIKSAQSETPETISAAEPESAEPEEELSETLIASIQLELKRLGYPIREIDGQLGQQTLAWIQSYQSSQGLALSNNVSPELLQHLQAQQGPQPRIQRSPSAQIRERPLAEWQRILQ